MDVRTEAVTRLVEAPAGRIAGRRDGAVVRFRGIPYAAAARFEPPRPTTGPGTPAAVGGTFEAFEPAPACPQDPAPVLDAVVRGANRPLPVSEDCLRLSVTAPADAAPEEALPVMVWIHGGSFTSGAGDLDMFDPAALVAEQRVVVVTVTYRLGLFGWLGDGERLPANLGLLDLAAAIEWVHANVGSFGGDADAVTLFGESAGGHAIAHLLLVDEVRRHVRRAIIQSAPLALARGKAPMVRSMLRAAGRPGAAESSDEILRRQRRAARVAPLRGPRGFMPFGPQLGQHPLPAESAADARWRAVARDVDVLIGTTRDEAALVLPSVPVLRGLLRVPGLGTALVRVLRRVVLDPLTRTIYEREARRFAERHHRGGGRVVRYRIGFRPPGSALGAIHSIDVPLLLGGRAAWTRAAIVGESAWPATAEAGRRLRRVWADFARTGRVEPGAGRGLEDVVRFRRPPADGPSEQGDRVG